VESSDGGVVLHTASGFRISGQRVVFATGYESQQYLKQNVGALKSTFALISEPCDSFEGWPDRSLIWESARPYFYLRTTSDERAIISGEDVPYATAHKSEQLIARKTKKLQRRFADMFPRLDLEVSYTWAGTFGETKDGLRTSARLQSFHMPILRSATAAMASRLASLRLRSSLSFIWVDRIRTPIFSGSIDEWSGRNRVARRLASGITGTASSTHPYRDSRAKRPPFRSACSRTAAMLSTSATGRSRWFYAPAESGKSACSSVCWSIDRLLTKVQTCVGLGRPSQR
jgi:hypothetical protein